jgi:DNA invertase Pin-like site-specific DNA recombinase
MTKPLRCAIYTRKSSEEGLEQHFNSLHAQREACAAYIASQVGEGWTPLPAEYDDGGYSGGSMDRPGLKALLADIRGGLVDVVVVYKVDRLTRSLADFARIVELFDQHQVSFVSVTQAFNTTTSMGRLTLNVLLSFAQFEREVTGERIRDKIAASKAKGMWMGGRPPLGYDGVDRKLVINPAEAEVVRGIFQRYLELGSVAALQPDLAERGVRAKRWTTKKGEAAGGGVLARGALYCLLRNRVYRGAIRHGSRLYENCHPAIIDEALWAAVQQLLTGNSPDHPATPRRGAAALLSGLVEDDRGNRMGVVHGNRRGKRYRYYASSALKIGAGRPGSLPRIAVGVLDAFIVAQVEPLLDADWRPTLGAADRVREALERVQLGAERIGVKLKAEAASGTGGSLGVRTRAAALEVSFDIRLKHRQGALVIAADGEGAAPNVDRALVRAVCLARAWTDELAQGGIGSTKELARREGLCDHYAARLMPLAHLAPDLVEQVLDGRQPPAMTLGALTKEPLPLDWNEQRERFAAFA